MESGLGSFDPFVISGEAGEEVVTDLVTGLVWKKTYTTGKTWRQALVYCESLSYAGHSDWRLPNVSELASLVSYNRTNPASDFPDMPSNWFWSSSTSVNDNDCAGYVYFDDGYMNFSYKVLTGLLTMPVVCEVDRKYGYLGIWSFPSHPNQGALDENHVSTLFLEPLSVSWSRSAVCPAWEVPKTKAGRTASPPRAYPTTNAYRPKATGAPIYRPEFVWITAPAPRTPTANSGSGRDSSAGDDALSAGESFADDEDDDSQDGDDTDDDDDSVPDGDGVVEDDDDDDDNNSDGR